MLKLLEASDRYVDGKPRKLLVLELDADRADLLLEQLIELDEKLDAPPAPPAPEGKESGK